MSTGGIFLLVEHWNMSASVIVEYVFQWNMSSSGIVEYVFSWNSGIYVCWLNSGICLLVKQFNISASGICLLVEQWNIFASGICHLVEQWNMFIFHIILHLSQWRNKGSIIKIYLTDFILKLKTRLVLQLHSAGQGTINVPFILLEIYRVSFYAWNIRVPFFS